MEDTAVIKNRKPQTANRKPKTENTYQKCKNFDIYFIFAVCGLQLAVFGLDAFITSDCFAEENKATKEEEASQEIKDFNLVQYTAGGLKKWELNGNTAKISEGLIEIAEPYAVLYGEKSKINISAEKGFYNKPQNDVELRQNVVVSSSDGMQMRADHLDWKADSQHISTDVPVLVTKDNLKATGRGASCNLAQKTIEFNEDVRANMEQEATQITCEGPLELDYGKNRAAFHKNVEVRDSQGHLLSDRMDVFFDPKTKKIVRVIASGNVRIIHGGNVTFSRVAIYLVDKKKVILPKRPKLTFLPQKEEPKDATE